MLIGKKKNETFWQRIRYALWPRRSWKRSFTYYSKRVRRLSGSPYTIAMGVACGVFAAVTPFFGFHILIALAAALILRGNLLAAGISTALCNPFTYPLILAGTYKLGRAIQNIGDSGAQIAQEITEAEIIPEIAHGLTIKALTNLWPVIKTMMIGAVPIGLFIALLAFIACYISVNAYRTARIRRLQARAANSQNAPVNVPPTQIPPTGSTSNSDREKVS